MHNGITECDDGIAIQGNGMAKTDVRADARVDADIDAVKS